MASEWPDQCSIDRVSTVSRAARRELFKWEPDPFRAGSSLREFPCRKATEFLLLRSRYRLIGMHGMLSAFATINGELCKVGGVSAFYLIPDVRRKGWSEPFHRFTREHMRKSWDIAGVLGFCLPAVLPIYLWMGATAVDARPLIDKSDGTRAPSPQPLFWWPFREDLAQITSLELDGPRW